MPGKCIRGTVLEVNLDPVVGHETGKTRPCVVIQNDIGNARSPVTIVAVITGAEHARKRYPVDVFVRKGEGGLVKDSVVTCNQIKTVDESRLGRIYGVLTDATMKRIDEALKISLALW